MVISVEKCDEIHAIRCDPYNCLFSRAIKRQLNAVTVCVSRKSAIIELPYGIYYVPINGLSGVIVDYDDGDWDLDDDEYPWRFCIEWNDRELLS